MKSYNQTIALDAMGGDYGPQVVIPAADEALKELGGGVKFLLVGHESEIQNILVRYPALVAASTVIHTDQKIENDEKPSAAIRRKDTSMRLAINTVKEGQAQSIVSAGNTGALMASSKMVLKCLPGITRPAIASVFPTKKDDTVMLDLGANLTCDAPILAQFAVLGAVYARVVKGWDNPTVGLLNIGTEDVKGPDSLREAAEILTSIDFPGEFKGFVEGNDITGGTVNVVVTDGFTGNVALKVAEGAGSLTTFYLKQAMQSSLLAKIGGVMASGALKKLKKRMDPRFYNGGMFLGLDGICVKSHGGMDSYGFSRAILVAANLVEQGYNERVAKEIAQLVDHKVVAGREEISESVAG